MIFALTSRRPRSVRGAGVGPGSVLKLNDVDDEGGVAAVVSVAVVILDLQRPTKCTVNMTSAQERSEVLSKKITCSNGVNSVL